MDIGDLRQEYTRAGLSRQDLDRDPIQQFERWFQVACAAQLPEPNALALATVSGTAAPFLRTVLLKYFDHTGFVFFTNLESAKAQHIRQNSQVALLFMWLALERQVQIGGTAVQISTEEALKYFATRPRGSQIGAWCSHQSSVISSRQLLLMQFDQLQRQFKDRKIPLPAFWGGYRVVPHRFEFWQGRPNRLHDRFLYTQEETSEWTIHRLAP